jgi:hypothetical protein
MTYRNSSAIRVRTIFSNRILVLPHFLPPGSNVLGADIKFYGSDGNLLLRREIKCSQGNANAFNGMLSRAAEAGKQAGGKNSEIWFQVPKGTNVQGWLNKFRSQPGRIGSQKYKGMTIKFINETGATIYSGPVIP